MKSCTKLESILDAEVLSVSGDSEGYSRCRSGKCKSVMAQITAKEIFTQGVYNVCWTLFEFRC